MKCNRDNSVEYDVFDEFQPNLKMVSTTGM